MPEAVQHCQLLPEQSSARSYGMRKQSSSPGGRRKASLLILGKFLLKTEGVSGGFRPRRWKYYKANPPRYETTATPVTTTVAIPTVNNLLWKKVPWSGNKGVFQLRSRSLKEELDELWPIEGIRDIEGKQIVGYYVQDAPKWWIMWHAPSPVYWRKKREAEGLYCKYFTNELYVTMKVKIDCLT